MAFSADYERCFSLLMEEVTHRFKETPGCHDMSHTLRVLHNARYLAGVEGADMVVVEFAAVLHDIGRLTELRDQGRTCHAELGGEMVGAILPSIGLTDSEFASKVAHCVRTHRYRRRTNDSPQTLEAQVIFDADKLDSIGAVGIGRSFHFAGRVGARLHNTDEEATTSASYSREDTAYREYLVKLRHVHEHMLTCEGRRIAESRHEFMVRFFEQLNREVAGPLPETNTLDRAPREQ